MLKPRFRIGFKSRLFSCFREVLLPYSFKFCAKVQKIFGICKYSKRFLSFLRILIHVIIESLEAIRIAHEPFGVTHPLQALSRYFRAPLRENMPPRWFMLLYALTTRRLSIIAKENDGESKSIQNTSTSKIIYTIR